MGIYRGAGLSTAADRERSTGTVRRRGRGVDRRSNTEGAGPRSVAGSSFRLVDGAGKEPAPRRRGHFDGTRLNVLLVFGPLQHLDRVNVNAPRAVDKLFQREYLPLLSRPSA